ncbi:MAG: dethiobiotin synthase [Gammaproteobacteria bacterium]|nr:dethiobiotin synthase [Gammaproteobacteria bacterium]
MKIKLPKRMFITGTGTDVGKTVISSILVSSLTAKYWKPIQCGLDETTDTQWIKNATNLDDSFFLPEYYRLSRPLSPHAAAAAENITIKLENFLLPELSEDESLIVEGAGGIMVPINEEHLIIDLIEKLQLPVLLVSSNILGTINHTLLSLEQLTRRGIEVIGVVLNGDSSVINRMAIEKYGQTQVIAEVPPIKQFNPEQLKDIYNTCF